jgi:hypothetical protein
MQKNVTKKDDLLNASTFNWFHGVVENVYDPKELGRIQVRAIGYHTEDKKAIPTFKLPWAHVSQSVAGAAFSTFGSSTTGIVNGMWVVGYFRDGQNAQDPLIIGVIPGTVQIPDFSVGFSDPFKQYPIKDGQKTKDGTPVSIRNTSDQPREATSAFKNTFSYEEQAAMYGKLSFEDDFIMPSRPIQQVHNPLYPNNNVQSSKPKMPSAGFADIKIDKVNGLLVSRKRNLFQTGEDKRPVIGRLAQSVSERDSTSDFERSTETHSTGTVREWNHLGEEYRNVISNRLDYSGKTHLQKIGLNSLTNVGRHNRTVIGSDSHINIGESEYHQTKYLNSTVESDLIGLVKGYSHKTIADSFTQHGSNTILDFGNVNKSVARNYSTTAVTNKTNGILTSVNRGAVSDNNDLSRILKTDGVVEDYISDTLREFYKQDHYSLILGLREENVRGDLNEFYESDHTTLVVGTSECRIRLNELLSVYGETTRGYHDLVTENYQKDVVINIGTDLDDVTPFSDYPFDLVPGVEKTPTGNRTVTIALDDSITVSGDSLSTTIGSNTIIADGLLLNSIKDNTNIYQWSNKNTWVNGIQYPNKPDAAHGDILYYDINANKWILLPIGEETNVLIVKDSVPFWSDSPAAKIPPIPTDVDGNETGEWYLRVVDGVWTWVGGTTCP